MGHWLGEIYGKPTWNMGDYYSEKKRKTFTKLTSYPSIHQIFIHHWSPHEESVRRRLIHHFIISIPVFIITIVIYNLDPDKRRKEEGKWWSCGKVLVLFPTLPLSDFHSSFFPTLANITIIIFTTTTIIIIIIILITIVIIKIISLGFVSNVAFVWFSLVLLLNTSNHNHHHHQEEKLTKFTKKAQMPEIKNRCW